MKASPHPLDKAALVGGGRDALAQVIGVTPAALGNWKARGVPIQRCIAIERATAGAVTRRDLRPDDWHLIWPELADSGTNPAQTIARQALPAINSEAKGVAHG